MRVAISLGVAFLVAVGLLWSGDGLKTVSVSGNPPPAAGAANDPQEAVEPDLKRLSLLADANFVDLQVDFYNPTAPSLGDPHIDLYGDLPHRYNIWLTNTTFTVRQDSDGDGHFETEVGTGSTSSSNGGTSWHASIPRSLFPDLVGMELWAYAITSRDRLPDRVGDLIIGPNQQLPNCLGFPATIVGTNNDDVIFGTPGRDVILGLDGHDIIDGLGGDDVICAGRGSDVVDGGDGNDKIWGERGPDVLSGGLGDDAVYGNAGADVLLGNQGHDRLAGGAPDRIAGGSGDDTILGGGHGDKLSGGAGDATT